MPDRISLAYGKATTGLDVTGDGSPEQLDPARVNLYQFGAAVSDAKKYPELTSFINDPDPSNEGAEDHIAAEAIARAWLKNLVAGSPPPTVQPIADTADTIYEEISRINGFYRHELNSTNKEEFKVVLGKLQGDAGKAIVERVGKSSRFVRELTDFLKGATWNGTKWREASDIPADLKEALEKADTTVTGSNDFPEGKVRVEVSLQVGIPFTGMRLYADGAGDAIRGRDLNFAGGDQIKFPTTGVFFAGNLSVMPAIAPKWFLGGNLFLYGGHRNRENVQVRDSELEFASEMREQVANLREFGFAVAPRLQYKSGSWSIACSPFGIGRFVRWVPEGEEDHPMDLGQNPVSHGRDTETDGWLFHAELALHLHVPLSKHLELIFGASVDFQNPLGDLTIDDRHTTVNDHSLSTMLTVGFEGIFR